MKMRNWKTHIGKKNRNNIFLKSTLDIISTFFYLKGLLFKGQILDVFKLIYYSFVGACGNSIHVLFSLSSSAVLILTVKEWRGSSWEVVSYGEVLRWPKCHPFMKPFPNAVHIWKKSLCNSSCLKAGW